MSGVVFVFLLHTFFARAENEESGAWRTIKFRDGGGHMRTKAQFFRDDGLGIELATMEEGLPGSADSDDDSPHPSPCIVTDGTEITLEQCTCFNPKPHDADDPEVWHDSEVCESAGSWFYGAGQYCNAGKCSSHALCENSDGKEQTKEQCSCMGADECVLKKVTTGGQYCNGGTCTWSPLCEETDGSAITQVKCSCEGKEECQMPGNVFGSGQACKDGKCMSSLACPNTVGTERSAVKCMCGEHECQPKGYIVGDGQFCYHDHCINYPLCEHTDGLLDQFDGGKDGSRCSCMGQDECDSLGDTKGTFCDNGVCSWNPTCVVQDGSKETIVDCKCGGPPESAHAAEDCRKGSFCNAKSPFDNKPLEMMGKCVYKTCDVNDGSEEVERFCKCTGEHGEAICDIGTYCTAGECLLIDPNLPPCPNELDGVPAEGDCNCEHEKVCHAGDGCALVDGHAECFRLGPVPTYEKCKVSDGSSPNTEKCVCEHSHSKAFYSAMRRKTLVRNVCEADTYCVSGECLDSPPPAAPPAECKTTDGLTETKVECDCIGPPMVHDTGNKYIRREICDPGNFCHAGQCLESKFVSDVTEVCKVTDASTPVDVDCKCKGEKTRMDSSKPYKYRSYAYESVCYASSEAKFCDHGVCVENPACLVTDGTKNSEVTSKCECDGATCDTGSYCRSGITWLAGCLPYPTCEVSIDDHSPREKMIIAESEKCICHDHECDVGRYCYAPVEEKIPTLMFTSTRATGKHPNIADPVCLDACEIVDGSAATELQCTCFGLARYDGTHVVHDKSATCRTGEFCNVGVCDKHKFLPDLTPTCETTDGSKKTDVTCNCYSADESGSIPKKFATSAVWLVCDIGTFCSAGECLISKSFLSNGAIVIGVIALAFMVGFVMTNANRAFDAARRSTMSEPAIEMGETMSYERPEMGQSQPVLKY